MGSTDGGEVTVNRRRLTVASLGVSAALTAALFTGIALSVPDHAASAHQAGPSRDVLIGHGADHLPSQSAQDWVTYADHVVVASAVSDREVPASTQELERGEGVIGRTVTLKVDKVLWSRDGAAQPAPATWDYSAMGWEFTDGSTDNRTRMAVAEQPRVEVGHTYIMALTWEQQQCAEGDGVQPAQWRGLGEGSEIPFDDAVIGNGELEGRTQTTQQAKSAAADAVDADDSLEDQMAGRTADALIHALVTAQPAQTAQQSARNALPADCG
ncbi:hypothetical protein SHKM778_75530 [Streptomyces sp. KM77-8]|uniref:Uncharacterized protein n=1 Tax=Streptomyces haneummycinicus TaxID=3074435 RepID=A0AAT9HU31_9ACTN